MITATCKTMKQSSKYFHLNITDASLLSMSYQTQQCTNSCIFHQLITNEFINIHCSLLLFFLKMVRSPLLTDVTALKVNRISCQSFPHTSELGCVFFFLATSSFSLYSPLSSFSDSFLPPWTNFHGQKEVSSRTCLHPSFLLDSLVDHEFTFSMDDIFRRVHFNDRCSRRAMQYNHAVDDTEVIGLNM